MIDRLYLNLENTNGKSKKGSTAQELKALDNIFEIFCLILILFFQYPLLPVCILSL